MVEMTDKGARLAGTSGEILGGSIDDMAKYRVVLHLLQRPWTMADAEFFARTLGFHSLPRTVDLLEEMCAAGLLQKTIENDARTVYGLPSDANLRWQLRKEYLVKRSSPDYTVLLRRLAWRSVSRAKKAEKAGAKAS